MQESKKEGEDTFLKVPGILDKYKAAAGIVEEALNYVESKSETGEDISTICAQGNLFMIEKIKNTMTGKKSKKIEKGIAFPTCISVNNVCGHFSPLKDESYTLKSGDIAKIDLGVHIDGYIAQGARTIAIGKMDGNEKQSNAVIAAHTAFNAAIRLLREGKTNTEVTSVITQIIETFGCNHLEGVLSHKVKKHLIDGNDCIIGRIRPDQRVQERSFEPGEIWVIDILVSSGEGKPKGTDHRSTVFKRVLENAYLLKMERARAFFSAVNRNYPTLPFSIADFEDATMAKIGVKECLEHDLLTEYPVLEEKSGETVAQFKGTVAVLSTGVSVLCGMPKPVDGDVFKSEHKVESQSILDILAFDLDKKAQKKAKKAAAAEGEKKEETKEADSKKE